jgi:hypothetical protein
VCQRVHDGVDSELQVARGVPFIADVVPEGLHADTLKGGQAVIDPQSRHVPSAGRAMVADVRKALVHGVVVGDAT